ncbi:DUF11 domain-containing protein [Pseudolysobacter antarcticus]|uniref:DUF11 domain-containing protein n=1 Tax=Pseudolysobacter antarcticus TaxID=2511995 RepID=A0A411HJX8_9GAMM|nr:DUF11 domain-containing protein [Pseudolysobacter antarcticus]QBB70704.1 DUF11 domain-containing protein [Pseudolysobacter antarcticus]
MHNLIGVSRGRCWAKNSVVSSFHSLVVGLVLSCIASVGFAEGSRSLYPASYPGAGFRADMDFTAAVPYAGVTARQQFLYVYANAGEYILLGSSNRANGGDVFVYNPQAFGTKGNETIPGAADFTCSAAVPPTGSFSGGTLGQIAARVNELAGPNSADNSTTVVGGYGPCAYKAPSAGIYGVRFSVATAGGGGPTGSVGTLHIGNNTVAAWEVAVRAGATSTTDINARTFTYGFIAFTGGNSRPVFHTLYYATPDGQRYQQTMQGLDPNGYALWGNQSGFFDNGQPLYKDIRGGNAQITPGSGQFIAELSAQGPQTPVFFNSIDPAGANAVPAAAVLGALGIPLSPPAPTINSPQFTGLQSGNQTYVGGGGTFTFTAANDTSYQIVISAGVDYDPANPLNATLTGLAPNGGNSVPWNGLANDGSAFPNGTFNVQIVGRNGEIHFPIIDSEGNANGGPVVTKLNGSPVGDATVYYDDRGYITRGGTLIGALNGLLCPANPPVPPTPDHALLGVDSSAQVAGVFYRHWPGNGNLNTDCAATAGFGDAKALDLWTYQQSSPVPITLVINPANITLSKSGPATAALGSAFNYTLGLGNSGALGSGTVVTVTDVLPAGVIANSVAPGTGVSGVNCGTLPSAAGATLSCTVTLSAPLAAGSASGTASFTLNATAAIAGSITNFASVDPSGNTNPPAPGASCTPTTSCGSATTLVLLPPTISKAFGAASIPLNGSTSLSFTITNPNAGNTLSGVGVTDNVPAGLVVATPNGLTGSCGGGTITAVAGSGNVTLSSATLAANASCTFSINVTGIAAGNQNNTTGNVTSTEGGNGGTASASVAVVAPPVIAKAFNPVTIALNGTTSLTFTIINPVANTVALTGVAFNDTLPVGLTLASGSVTVCGGTLTKTAPTGITLVGANIAIGSPCQFSVTVTGTAGGQYTNVTGNVSSTNGGTGNTGTANLAVVIPPTIIKAFGAPSIALNGATSLNFTVGNPNTGLALTGLAFTDTLPAGLVIATPNGASNTCGGAITAVAGSGAVSLAGGTLPANANCTITVNVQGTTAGVKNNSVTVTSTEGGTGNTSNASITVLAPPTIIKSFGAASIALNGSTSLSFTIVNPNTTSSLSGVGVTDTLPAGLTIATPSGLSGSCGGGTITAIAGSGSVSLSGATLIASASCTFSINVTGTAVGMQNNTTGNVTSTEGGNGGTASASIDVIGPPTVAKSFNPTTIAVGGTSTLTIVVTNTNTIPITGAAFTDTLPANVTTLASTAATTCAPGTASQAPGSLSLAGATIPASGNCTVTVTVTSTQAGVYTNTIPAGGVTTTNAGSNTTPTSATLTVSALLPPAVAKTFNPATIPVNGTSTLTITLTNPNTATAITGAAFTDTLPANVTTIAATAATTCAPGVASQAAGSLTLAGGTIPANGSCMVTVNVTSAIGGVYNNTIAAGDVTTTNAGSNTTPTSATLTVLGPPVVVKAFNPITISVNGTSTLTITLTNPNATTAITGVAFADTLPANVTTVAGTAATTCAPGVVSQTAGAVSLAGATIPASGNCTVTVSVTSATPGAYTNTILAGGVTSTNAGSNTTPTSSTLTVNAVALVPPTVAKSFSPATIAVNGTSMLTITVSNSNAIPITGVTLIDNLPAGVTTVASTVATNCAPGTPAQTTGSVSMAGGTTAANGSCTVTVTVTAATLGAYTNTIPAGGVTSTNAGSNTTPATSTLTVSAPLVVAQIPALNLWGLLMLGLVLSAGGFYIAQRRGIRPDR